VSAPPPPWHVQNNCKPPRVRTVCHSPAWYPDRDSSPDSPGSSQLCICTWWSQSQNAAQPDLKAGKTGQVSKDYSHTITRTLPQTIKQLYQSAHAILAVIIFFSRNAESHS
jgi:hypothetical protein